MGVPESDPKGSSWKGETVYAERFWHHVKHPKQPFTRVNSEGLGKDSKLFCEQVAEFTASDQAGPEGEQEWYASHLSFQNCYLHFRTDCQPNKHACMELAKYQKQAAEIENQHRQELKDQYEIKAAKYQVKGFWWTLIISITSLILSIIAILK